MIRFVRLPKIMIFMGGLLLLVALGFGGVYVKDQEDANQSLIAQGQQTFRFDTFGDEAFWGDTIQLHKAIETVSPATALAVGLKVDVDALPKPLQNQLRKGNVDLNSPATTLALLKLNAVTVGILDRNT